MSHDRALFDEAWKILAYHNKGRRTTKQTLNRLFAEHIGIFFEGMAQGLPQIWEDNLAPRKEHWSVAQLDRLNRIHDKAQPERSDLSILVVEYRGVLCLIDGTNRVNKATKDQPGRLHAVIVLRVGDADLGGK